MAAMLMAWAQPLISRCYRLRGPAQHFTYKMLELLYRVVRSEAELQRILVKNPAQLFGYSN